MSVRVALDARFRGHDGLRSVPVQSDVITL